MAMQNWERRDWGHALLPGLRPAGAVVRRHRHGTTEGPAIAPSPQAGWPDTLTPAGGA